MYVTSVAVQAVCVLRRTILRYLEANEGTPEQYEFAVAELLNRIHGLDSDEMMMYLEYIEATEATEATCA